MMRGSTLSTFPLETRLTIVDSLDASFAPWSTDLRQQLLSRFPLPGGVEAIAETTLLEPKWKLSLLPSATNGIAKAALNGDHLESFSINGAPQMKYESGSTTVHHGAFSNDIVSQNLDVTLRENRRMTPDTHWQDVRHLAFHCRSPASYGPGDVLSIFPQNDKNDVDQLLERMDWAEIADKPIMFTPTIAMNQGGRYPSPPVLLSGKTTTLRLLLTNHLDVTAIPRRSFFALIAHFTNDPFHNDRLLEFTKPEYVDELYDYTTRPRRSILEVLQEFESVKIPWQWAANVFPELRGRQFSIASGGTLKKDPDGMARFELLVAIVKYKTVIRKIREGVCTRYLANLTVGTELRVALQKGSLAIKRKETKRPVIMIGPGTGVAPMRSLAWERLQLLRDMEDPASIGSNLLFFGCRSKSADYFYSEEWGRLEAMMPLEVHAAFSRDQNHKVYVQDLIRQQSESVFRLLHESDGLVYVCGSSGKMPQAVRAALIDVFVERGMEQQAAKGYLEAMEKEGRYKQETW